MAMRRLLALIVGLLLLGIPVGAQLPAPPATQTASLTSATSTTLNVAGYASLALQITGTWTATVQFEGSIDGSTYVALNATPPNSSTSVTSTAANGIWLASVGGLKYVRARVSAYTSGTIVLTLQAALAGGSSGGGGGGAASSVTVNDPTITTQKAAVNASGQLSITCANCSGSGASAVDNSVFTAGTTSGAPAMGFYHTTIDTVTDGNTATVAIDSKRNQFFVVRDAAGNARGANVSAGNALLIDGSAVTQPVSGTVTAAQATAGNLNATVVGTGTFAVQAAQSGNFLIQGLVAHDAVYSGNPLPNGCYASAAAPTDVSADADIARMWCLRNGATVVNLAAGGTLITATSSSLNANVTNTVTVSGTVTTTPPANASTNVAQLAGTTTDTNSGVKSAGTLRVVLATDQPALTNKLLVTPDSVALPANQSVNVAQLAGTATDTNSGSKSAGTLRVVLATDQPQLTAKLLVTPDSVALPANQSVNVAQMNGVATTMGAGATGTGVQRVNDVASSATGAAPPASAIYVAGLGSGATGGFLTGVSVGDTNKVVNVSTATTTLMVTGVSGRQVHITAFHLMTNAANSVAWLEGTGATCGTGTAGMAGGTTAASGYNFAANGGIAMGSGYGDVLATATTGDSVCLITSAATQLSGFIKYTIY